METEIVIPQELAVITLPDMAFFPQALLPLHIFEPRYRLMLERTLSTHRQFAVAGIDPAGDPTEERGHRVATVGIVRACNQNDDGTSNLLLQGLIRVECLGIVRERPYRVVRVRPLASESSAPEPENRKLCQQVEQLLDLKKKLGAEIPADFASFLHSVDDPETFVDLAAFTLCRDAALKQRLLETLDVHRRLQIYTRALCQEVEALGLRRKLQGDLADEDIANN